MRQKQVHKAKRILARQSSEILFRLSNVVIFKHLSFTLDIWLSAKKTLENLEFRPNPELTEIITLQYDSEGELFWRPACYFNLDDIFL